MLLCTACSQYFKWIQKFKIQEVFKNTRGGGTLLGQAFNYVGVLAHRQLMQWSCAQPLNKFLVSWNRAEEVIEKKNSASNTLVNWVTQSEHWKCNNRCQESDRAIKIIMAWKELDTTSTCCVVWENSLHLTRKSGRILSIEKWTHLMRVKFKENSNRPGSHRE